MAWAHSGCGCWQIGSKIPKCFFQKLPLGETDPIAKQAEICQNEDPLWSINFLETVEQRYFCFYFTRLFELSEVVALFDHSGLVEESLGFYGTLDKCLYKVGWILPKILLQCWESFACFCWSLYLVEVLGSLFIFLLKPTICLRFSAWLFEYLHSFVVVRFYRDCELEMSWTTPNWHDISRKQARFSHDNLMLKDGSRFLSDLLIAFRSWMFRIRS